MPPNWFNALRNQNRIVASSLITVLGISYREDVGDTRYSGSELLVRKLSEMGSEVRVHDPYVEHWWGRWKNRRIIPLTAVGHDSFGIRKDSKNLKVSKGLPEALKGADAVVLAVRHQPYLGPGSGPDKSNGLENQQPL